MTQFERAFRRLTVVLDATYCAECDWDSASELARVIGVDLEALFVEDIDVFRLATLPFAREVGHASGQDRPIERESVESMLRGRVKTAKEQLARASERRNVAVTHATERGKVVHSALAHGAEGDVLPLRSSSVRRAPAPRRARATPRGPVMLWHEEGPLARASCELAVHLAQQSHAGLILGWSARDLGGEGVIHARLGDLLSAPGPLWTRPLPDCRIDSLIEVARAARVTELVLSARGVFVTPESIERIRHGDRLDLILVR